MDGEEIGVLVGLQFETAASAAVADFVVGSTSCVDAAVFIV